MLSRQPDSDSCIFILSAKIPFFLTCLFGAKVGLTRSAGMDNNIINRIQNDIYGFFLFFGFGKVIFPVQTLSNVANTPASGAM